MKVVTNRCFGGFGLSPDAEKLYMKKQGKDLFFYQQTKYKHCDGINEYTKIDPARNQSLFTHTYTTDLGDSFQEHPDDDSGYWYSGGLKRDDPILIQVIEELGVAANGQCADLQITEIPDGIDYTIEEYDGNEHIAENHATW